MMKKYVDVWASLLLSVVTKKINGWIFLVMAITLFSFSFSLFKHWTGENDKTKKNYIFDTDLLGSSWEDFKGLKARCLTKLDHLIYQHFYLDLKPLSKYVFYDVLKPFGKIRLHRSEGLSGEEFEQLILNSVPSPHREKLGLYLTKTMHLATQYQIDPFWVLAVMWVESNFEKDAMSSKDAMGLMQIMPDTGKFIADKLKYKTEKDNIFDLIWAPHTNIEMGIYYLNYLLDQYKNDYILATLAYNYGPGKLRELIDEDQEFISENNYLKKVKRAYFFITREYVRLVDNRPELIWLAMQKNSKNPKNSID